MYKLCLNTCLYYAYYEKVKEKGKILYLKLRIIVTLKQQIRQRLLIAIFYKLTNINFFWIISIYIMSIYFSDQSITTKQSIMKPLQSRDIYQVVASEGEFILQVLSEMRKELQHLTDEGFKQLVRTRVRLSQQLNLATSGRQESRQMELCHIEQYFRNPTVLNHQYFLCSTQWQSTVKPQQLISMVVWRARQTLFFMGITQFQRWMTFATNGAIDISKKKHRRPSILLHEEEDEPFRGSEIVLRQFRLRQFNGPNEMLDQPIRIGPARDTKQTERVRREKLILLQRQREQNQNVRPRVAELEQPNIKKVEPPRLSHQYYGGQDKKDQEQPLLKGVSKAERKRIMNVYQSHTQQLIRCRIETSFSASSQGMNRGQAGQSENSLENRRKHVRANIKP